VDGNEDDRGLLEGEPILPLAYPAEPTGISVAQLISLLQSDSLPMCCMTRRQATPPVEASMPSRVDLVRMLAELE
jgi:hypothetical protein